MQFLSNFLYIQNTSEAKEHAIPLTEDGTVYIRVDSFTYLGEGW